MDVGPEVVNLVSHATQQRLQNLLEKVTVIAQQKNMNYKVCIPALSEYTLQTCELK